MSRPIKTINDGSIIEYDHGKFDDWCVYLTRSGKAKLAPTDIQYFSELSELGHLYGHQKIYNDFLRVYRPTNATVSQHILDYITLISLPYGIHSVDIDIWFTVIYAGMVAEENKQHARLKKRIKRLGMYQLLVEQKPAAYAASFSKGKPWRELDGIMQGLGF
jgi:hypothetical protein